MILTRLLLLALRSPLSGDSLTKRNTARHNEIQPDSSPIRDSETKTVPDWVFMSPPVQLEFNLTTSSLFAYNGFVFRNSRNEVEKCTSIGILSLLLNVLQNANR